MHQLRGGIGATALATWSGYRPVTFAMTLAGADSAASGQGVNRPRPARVWTRKLRRCRNMEAATGSG
jgi:hypothetical protein